MCCYGDNKLCDHTASKHRQWEACPSCGLQAAWVYVVVCVWGCVAGLKDWHLNFVNVQVWRHDLWYVQTQNFEIVGAHCRLMR